MSNPFYEQIRGKLEKKPRTYREIVRKDYLEVAKKRRLSQKERRLGSLRELDTQLIIAKEVDLAEKELFTPIMNEVEEMQRILTLARSPYI
ncbi:MAG: four helix bundle protein [Iphinoe sp. HA4291-MV1]|nr:four helix bundle protein [Iphinoe sp. HA4291-MV1]